MPMKRRALAFLLAWAGAAPAQAGPALQLFTETSPPSSMLENGRVVGISTNKVREMMTRAGIGYTIELLPWKRAYGAALERADACVFSTTRTPEREALFKWIGPTDEADWVLMARAGSGIKLSTLEDARRYTIGTYNGDVRDQYLRQRGFKVDPAPDDWINPSKLMLGRIDLWAAALRSGSTVLERHGWDKRLYRALTFKQIRVYLACNRAVPDALVARMNAALDTMRRDGSARRIERSYENWNPPLPNGGN